MQFGRRLGPGVFNIISRRIIQESKGSVILLVSRGFGSQDRSDGGTPQHMINENIVSGRCC